jgi:Xaa-Pro dipeptidase
VALHFPRPTFAAREDAARAAMAKADLDALLLFKPESMYYLSGYDTFGYCFFQCLILPRVGAPVLLTRSADLRQARHTSTVQDVRVWTDGADADPAVALRDLLDELGLRGRRLGAEYRTHGLTAFDGRRLDAALDGFAETVDASSLVTAQRLVKSAEELAFVRRAAELADDAWEAALETARAGADEATILAAMQSAVFLGGGDYPGNPFIIGSGPDALLCRYKTGRRRLDAQDQLTLEFAGVYRHYHACLMRTLVIGAPSAAQIELFDTCRAALLACEARLVSGGTIGAVFAAHAETLDARGLGAHRLNACGYSLGAVYPPSWMDEPMVYADSPTRIAPGMVIFLHMIVMDSERGLAMTLGRTSIVGQDGAEPLSAAPLELLAR